MARIVAPPGGSEWNLRIIFFFVAILVGLLVVTYATLAWRHGRTGALEKLLGPIERERFDFAHLQLTTKPNQYLVCPEELCTAVAHREAAVYDVSARQLRDAWHGLVMQKPRVECLDADDETLYYDYEAKTPLFQFPDTITVWFIPVSLTRSTLAIYSRSHYGHSDLGANKKRIDSWLKELDASIR